MALGQKTGGRKKGSKNKVSVESKKFIADFFSSYINSDGLKTDKSFSDDFNALDAKERILVTKDFLPYFVPKLQAVDFVSTDTNKSVLPEIIQKLEEENKKIKEKK